MTAAPSSEKLNRAMKRRKSEFVFVCVSKRSLTWMIKENFHSFAIPEKIRKGHRKAFKYFLKAL